MNLWRTSKLQEKVQPSKKEHPAPQNMKFLHLLYFCQSLIRIQVTKKSMRIVDPCRSWSTTLGIQCCGSGYGSEPIMNANCKECSMTFLSFFHIKILFRIRPVLKRSWSDQIRIQNTVLMDSGKKMQDCKKGRGGATLRRQILVHLNLTNNNASWFRRTRQKPKKWEHLQKTSRLRHIFWLKVTKQRPIFNRILSLGFQFLYFLFL